MRSHTIPCIALLVITAAVYASVLDHDFLVNWDDAKYVTDNEAVKGFSVKHLKTAFSTFYVGNYAPLHIVSYMLDYSIWGMKAAGFLLTNILLHAANGILLYFILIRLSWRNASSFITSFIFLLHPVQVESVAWISQRKNPLSMFFFLLAFYFYMRYKEGKFLDGKKTLYCLSLILYICALLSKPVVVIFPILILLYDVCFETKYCNKVTILDKLPYILFTILISLLAIFTQYQEFDARTIYHGSLWATFITMLPVFGNYLRMLFYPMKLSAVYSPVIRTEIDSTVILSMLLLIFLIGIGAYLYKNRREHFFWFAFFFVGFLPVSQIVPLVTLINDRYLYFPMVGAAAFLIASTEHVVMLLTPPVKKIVIFVLCLALLWLPILSIKRAEVWQNSIALWSDATRKEPENAEAWRGLGVSYQIAELTDNALAAYLKALKYAPFDYISLHNVGFIYMNKMEFNAAQEYLLQLIRTNPEYVPGYVTLGTCYLRTGEPGLAEKFADQALALDPKNQAALKLLDKVHYVRDQYFQ